MLWYVLHQCAWTFQNPTTCVWLHNHKSCAAFIRNRLHHVASKNWGWVKSYYYPITISGGSIITILLIAITLFLLHLIISMLILLLPIASPYLGDQHPLASYDLGYHLRAPHIMVGEGKSSPNGVEIIERFRLSKDNSRRFLRSHPNCTPHSWDKFQHILHDHPTNRKWLISPRS